MNTRKVIERVRKDGLWSASLLAVSVLIILVQLLAADTASADNGNSVIPHDYGYHYDAVCDFILARIFEADAAITADGNAHVTKQSTEKGRHAFRFERDGLRVEYEMVDLSYRSISDLDIRPPGFGFNTDKEHLYKRFAIKKDASQSAVTLSCDMQELTLTFKEKALVGLHIVVGNAE